MDGEVCLLGNNLRMFDMSPCRSNSKAARLLMYSLPVKSYYFDDSHINLTLQGMLQSIVSDLNELAMVGLQINGRAPC